MTTIRKRLPSPAAARGAALLDRDRPGWWRSVKIRTLDIADSCQCVLGQVFANKAGATYESAAWGQCRATDGYEWGRWTWLEGLTRRRTPAEYFGFDAESFYTYSDDADTYAALAEAWRAEIRVRRDMPKGNAA